MSPILEANALIVATGADTVIEYDGLNTLLARHTHGPGIDDPVMLVRDLDASGTFDECERSSIRLDGLGRVTGLTDSKGVAARVTVYDSYGQIAQDTGGVENAFTFTSREFDAECQRRIKMGPYGGASWTTRCLRLVPILHGRNPRAPLLAPHTADPAAREGWPAQPGAAHAAMIDPVSEAA